MGSTDTQAHPPGQGSRNPETEGGLSSLLLQGLQEDSSHNPAAKWGKVGTS